MARFERNSLRVITQQRRNPPSGGRVFDLFNFDTIAELLDRVAAPQELCFTVTDGRGRVASWFDDALWTSLILRWGQVPMSVAIAPSPGALLHGVVLHELEMVRRVAPTWRILGSTSIAEFKCESELQRLARSPYHEVFLVDGAAGAFLARRAGTDRDPAYELIRLIRAEQFRHGLATPVLFRLPAA